MDDLNRFNEVLESETGWRVEVAISPFDQSEFLRLYRKVSDSWNDKEFVASFPRDAQLGTMVACGMVAKHYHDLGKTLAI